ncbi:hypothetical protein [Saccharothrix longispora]|uniref:hypothetical protein n=1 Tax=Saccharothrix longispora TaxID=33920 RepID=UPI0028FD5C2C|nr:hypothetical protein [Saccharothrix longispora]MDU0292398.1 hypothetical protein [Saccharothrix longispora]
MRLLRSCYRWFLAHVPGGPVRGPVVGLVALFVINAALAFAPWSTATRVLVGLLPLLAAGLALVAYRVNSGVLERHRTLLAHYADVIYDELQPLVHIVAWEERATLAANGDAETEVTVTATPAADGVRVLRLRFQAGWDQPEAQRSLVKAVVRGVLVDELPGARFAVSTSWREDGRFDLAVHFQEPIPAGSEVRVVVTLFWPGKCAPLMRFGEPDAFAYRFAGSVPHVSLALRLPRGVDVFYDALGFDRGDPGFVLESVRSPADRTEVVFSATDLQPDRRVGVRLDVV